MLNTADRRIRRSRMRWVWSFWASKESSLQEDIQRIRVIDAVALHALRSHRTRTKKEDTADHNRWPVDLARSDIRSLCKIIGTLRQSHNTALPATNGAKGELLTDPDEIQKKWSQHWQVQCPVQWIELQKRRDSHNFHFGTPRARSDASSSR